MTLRALLVCPGRGSYGRAQLGGLPACDPIVAVLDRYRATLGRRPTISELDRATSYTPRLHVAGEHASLLTFACTAVDVAAIDTSKISIACVTGNSMGFYTALYAAGALELDAAARLVETLGHYQTDNVIGAQLVYPIVGDDWRLAPAQAAAVGEVVSRPGIYVSINLGGAVVLGVAAEAIDDVRRILPPVDHHTGHTGRGGLAYPLQLPLHSAFHTPLMQPTAARAQADLADLPMQSPRVTLIGGDGVVYRPWADPMALWQYTLGPQITETFDLERAIGTALGELAPDVLVLPGPGDNLGGALAQILIGRRWRGLRDRADFMEAQAGDRPIVLAMSRPEQRARVTS